MLLPTCESDTGRRRNSIAARPMPYSGGITQAKLCQLEPDLKPLFNHSGGKILHW
jgi:hypothetical protein